MTEAASVDVRISATGATETLAQLVAVRDAAKSLSGTVSLKMDATAVKAAAAEVTAAEAAMKRVSSTPLKFNVDAAQIEQASASLGKMETQALSASSALSKMAAPAAFLGIGIGLTKMGADFQTLSTNIQNNTTMTSADVQVMNETIKRLSAEGGASLGDLADGFMHAFNISGNATDATKILDAAMKSAVSTGARTSDVTNSLAKVMHQFGIGAGDAAIAMDELHLGAALGNTTLEDFVDNSAKSFVAASSLHVPLDQVIAGFVGLTRAGFDANQANTQLAGILTHIVTPSKAAKDELAKLSKASGIDLVADFSLAGLKAKGLTGVLQDLTAATHGQEDAILRVIPAQRGAIGALALTGASAKDVKDAMDALANVTGGRATPTMDAYTRTQATLGNQLAVLRQQMKLAATDLGQDAVPAVSQLVQLLNSVPDGVKKIGIEFVMAGVGLKALGTAANFLGGLAGRLTVKEAVAVEAASVETSAVEGSVVASTAGIGAKLKPIVIPVAIVLAVTHIAGAIAEGPTEDYSAAKVRANSALEKQIAEQSAFWRTANEDELKANKDILVDNSKRIMDEAQKELETYEKTKTHKALGFINKITGLPADAHDQELKTQLEDAKRNFDELQGYLDSKFNPNSGKTPEQVAAIQTEQEATAAAKEHSEALREQSAVYLAMGANASTINTALFGKENGASAAEIKTATGHLKELTDAFATAQKQLGALDFSKGLTGLLNDLPKLRDAADVMGKFGQLPSGLQDLVGIGQQFEAIAAAERNASAAFDGYLATLSMSNSRIGQLEAFKKEVEAVVTAAEAAKKNGTATDAQISLLTHKDALLGNILSQENQIRANEAADILGAGANLPNAPKFDQEDRDLIKQYGGGKALGLRVQADTRDAISAIRAIEAGDYTATINVGARYSGNLDLPQPSGPGIGGAYAAGGDVAGDYAIVGDSPGGGINRTTEVVDFRNRRVFSHAQAVGMGLFGRNMPHYDGGLDPGGGGASGLPDTVNGLIPGAANNAGRGGSGPGSGAGAATTNLKAATAAAKELQKTLVDVGNAANVFAGYLRTLSADNLKAVTSEFDHQFSLLTKINTEKLGPKASEQEKWDATNAALAQSLDVTIAWARALQDAQDPANDLSADFQKIRDTGTPIAENLIRQVSILREMNIAQAKIKADDQAIADLEAAHTAQAEKDAAADRKASRDKITLGWADAYSMKVAEDAWKKKQRTQQDAQDQENQAWTTESRQWEDKTRALDHYGTARKQQLTDEMTAIDLANKAATSAFKAQEQLLGASAAGGDGAASMRLAIGRDAQKTAADAFTTQKAAIQDAITAEDKLATQQKYDLETLKIAATRAHEDRLNQLREDATTASRNHEDAMERAQALKTQQEQTDQRHIWDQEDQRIRDENKYKADKLAADNQKKADDAHLKDLDTQLTNAQTIEALWEKIAPMAGDTANALLTAFSEITGANLPRVTVRATAGSDPSNPYTVMAKAVGAPSVSNVYHITQQPGQSGEAFARQVAQFSTDAAYRAVGGLR